MHIELTEMLRCPEAHAPDVLVLSTGEVAGRMVRTGLVGCPVCRQEYPIVRGVVHFSGGGMRDAGSVVATERPHLASRIPHHEPDAQALQALLDLSGPGGFVGLVGSAARYAVALAGLMGGIHFVGVNPPPDVEELPVLSLLACATMIPLRQSIARGVVVGPELARAPWIAEAHRVLLRGRRVVVEDEAVAVPEGVTKLAVGHGLFVGERR
jgi:uncharacterized protein YbaR (Trm112 family)